MKAIFCALFALGMIASAHAHEWGHGRHSHDWSHHGRGFAEIQIFYGYHGYDDYDYKVVSTSYDPLSIQAILDGHRTAACYKGDPEEALDLFEHMVDLYNYDNRRDIEMVDGDYYFYRDGKGALRIETLDERGRSFLSFPRMIECDRWSTPGQRAN
jgi:hypothetical protein